MAKGRLGISTITPSVNTAVYTVPASTSAAVSLTVLNKGLTDAVVSINLCTAGEIVGGNLPDASFIEYNTTIPSYGLLERTGVVLDAGKSIYAFTTSSDVNVVVVGVEESQT